MRPADQINNDDIIQAQQKMDRRARSGRAAGFRRVMKNLRMNGGLGLALRTKREAPGEKSLAELAEKAKRAPRDG